MKYILSTIIITSCSMSMKTKEWNDSYDPAQWRSQYELCKDVLNTEKWTECMGDFS